MPVRGFYGGKLRRRYTAELVSVRISDRMFRLGDFGFAPDPTLLTLDPSTPAVVTVGTGGGPAVSPSFTPPAGALLDIEWCGDSDSGLNPAQPTITDSLGTHLTYIRSDWVSRADAPAVSGQAAMWSARVGASATMTISVTSGSATATAGALKVRVWVNAAGVGAHGKASSASAASIAQAYTALATGGWGVGAVTDWDVKGPQTAGTGCAIDVGESANLGSQITYGFVRRHLADDVNGVSNSINVTIPATSTNLSWVWAEILQAVALPGSVSQPPLRMRLALQRRRRATSVVPTQAVVAASAYPPDSSRTYALRWVATRRRRGTEAVPEQSRPVASGRTRARVGRPGKSRSVTTVPTQAAPAAPTYPPEATRAVAARWARLARHQLTLAPAQDFPPQATRGRVRALPLRARARTTLPPAQEAVWTLTRIRVRQVPSRRPRRPEVVPAQVVLTAPAYVPQVVRAKLFKARLSRGRTATVVPAQVAVSAPTYPPQRGRSVLREVYARRGRTVTPTPMQDRPLPVPRTKAAAKASARRGRTITAVPDQPTPLPVAPTRLRTRAAVQRPARRAAPVPVQAAPIPATVPSFSKPRLRAVARLRRPSRQFVPAQIILIAPAYVPMPLHVRRALWAVRRHRAGVEGFMVGGVVVICETPRPSSGLTARPSTGTTAYSLTTTARPSSGTSARPDSGDTSEPC